ncbi:MAG: YihY/virulence factor BrkB family protein [Lachnospiraceae bacterium]|nr:YihY/virulence factor BrkB family protein [Lachnospiraceae bacterium]
MLFTAIRTIRKFLTQLRDDSISAFAAHAAFFIILSIIPFIMFLITLLNLFPLSTGDLSGLSAGILSGTAALWSASRGTLALVRGLNAVYKHKETRNYFFLRALSMLYTLCFAVLLVATLVLLVFGNRLYNWIVSQLPILKDLAFLIMSLRSLITIIILTLFFLLLYLVIPNRKSRILTELPGAIIAAGGWMGFSFLFSFYIDYSPNASFAYGSLTTLAFSMLWLYFCMYLLFVGAEINVFLSNGRDK